MTTESRPAKGSAFQPWMRNVRAGDVLATPDGDLRVVRYARVWRNKYSGQEHLTLYLAIRRCSWTHRAYTVIGTQDIAYRRYRPTGKRVRLTSPVDKKLAHDIAYENRFKPCLDCCDVKGVP